MTLLDGVNDNKFVANSYVSTLEKEESVLELGMSASTGKACMMKEALISHTSVTLGQLQGLVSVIQLMFMLCWIPHPSPQHVSHYTRSLLTSSCISFLSVLSTHMSHKHPWLLAHI